MMARNSSLEPPPRGRTRKVQEKLSTEKLLIDYHHGKAPHSTRKRWEEKPGNRKKVASSGNKKRKTGSSKRSIAVGLAWDRA